MNKIDPVLKLHELKQFGEFGGVNPSITDSATYTFMGAQTMTDTFEGKAEGCFLYSRHWNPSNKYLSDALAAMEGTEAGWVTASGMGAITCALLHEVSAGDHIVSSVTTYGGTFAFLKNYIKKFNVEVTFVNISDLDEVAKAMRPNTKVLYTESLSNPLLQFANLPELKKIAQKSGAKLIVDNTFTPMIISPYQHGADVVVYSLTKFVNGKNDCVAGAICGTADYINSLINVNDGTAMLLGPVLDPLRSSSILKNLYTLHIRMQQHSKNALYLSQQLQEKGYKVKYTGLPNHPDYKLFTSMMNKGFGYGGILTIDVKSAKVASAIMEEMQDRGVGYLAVSLGYFRTLFSNSGKSTSSEIPEDIQKEMGMSEGLIRFSMGLDNDIERTTAIIMEILKKHL
ncbi:MAG TPA: aminotransferase class I/II-fold pyridoxal phosphate-dependent enzyme [Bacteroidales bacterium]|nr:aminotransferase class I/II-fold pyridoxal phosphate-dependent enzyme [Bacteroidales bacterium]HON19818.1 aminotransferase class I/II-fold pyridoxal phosphate-dependent enzyme [Bacteroidales bacterium]HOR82150.1 aminotransferase class I/II-fold pyridoxal phosphate-dependent enzyme [Bacteroidales bacterium]HPJ91450.1 aminotransferase class I/II-fold pyridoxal phosphate-dependent enzyme [Bacteroidales bacterium]HQB19136.1 aminotransferase class I/II-fold pyridoxal phosphate-dependent enzyme [B